MTTAASRVFASVFPSIDDLGHLGLEKSTNDGPTKTSDRSGRSTRPSRSNSLEAQWQKAWGLATIHLAIPHESIALSSTDAQLRKHFVKKCDVQTKSALATLLSSSNQSVDTRMSDGARLIKWYYERQVVDHYVEYMLPSIQKLLESEDNPANLDSLVRLLRMSHMIYFQQIENYVDQFAGDDEKASLQCLQHDFQSLFMHTIPRELLASNLRVFFRRSVCIILDTDREMHTEQSTSPGVFDTERADFAERLLSLAEVGIHGNSVEALFAEVMYSVLRAHVRQCYARRWEIGNDNVAEVKQWIRACFADMVALFMQHMTPDAHNKMSITGDEVHPDVEKWEQIAVDLLGLLRVEELFDLMENWATAYGAAIDDLRTYIKNPSSRKHLISAFTERIEETLLHPAYSTEAILQVYMSVIRAFTILEPRADILHRIARPIRRYLREREDSVHLVVAGILTDPNQCDDSSSRVQLDIAAQMANHDLSLHKADDYDTNFDDMTWMPDPVDVGPDFRHAQNSDIVGSLISLFESKDIFVKEFQKTLGERLLKGSRTGIDREVRAIELLKLRFGETALQACEVMMKDIIDSQSLNAEIQENLHLREDPSAMDEDDSESLPDSGRANPTTFSSRIISYLYWPTLHSETFDVPRPVLSLRGAYEQDFEQKRHTRKLTWLDALGAVTIHLELEDRSVTEEVQTWQASVIYAFNQADDAPAPLRLTTAYLTSTLSMPEPLVLNALTFWMGKLILKFNPPSTIAPPIYPKEYTSTSDPELEATYTVIEKLSPTTVTQTTTALAAAADAAVAAAPPFAVLSDEEIIQEKMGTLYGPFVTGMLTNAGAMPLMNIVMMLKMTVPGGFEGSGKEEDGLRGWLEKEVKEGRVEFKGGNYKIA